MRAFFIILLLLIGYGKFFSNPLKYSKKDTLSRTALIGTNDSIVFALANATLTTNYIDIPVRIKSDEIINAVDFAFKFDETKLTYDTIFNFKSYLSALANFNTFDHYLRFTSSSLQPIDTNVVLIVIRFNILVPCAQIQNTDFNSIEAYLNGDPAKKIFSNSLQILPNANFTNSNSCQNSLVTFTDASTILGSSIISWQWNFGNGQFSSLQNPIITYTTSTTYTTSLIVTSAAGCTDSVYKSITISQNPISSFSYTLDCLKDSVYFSNTSTILLGTISNTYWNFGDLSTSTFTNPSHHYNSGGIYIVSLVSTSSASCIGNYTMAIVLNKPSANFTQNSLNNCTGTSISFSDTSTYSSGTITSWAWDFGDGNTSSVQNPIHTYSLAGNYSVTLLVTSNLGCNGSITKTFIVNSKPNVQFSSSNLVGCLPAITNFQNNSTNIITPTYLWNFGDNVSSVLQNPIHTYTTSGTFNVTLIIQNGNGCIDSLIKPSFILVNESPSSNYSFSGGCANSNSNFLDNSSISSGTISTWYWNFGDGNFSNSQNPTHTYATSGTYVITLTSTSTFSCSNTFSNTIIINSKPNVQFNGDNLMGCAPLNVNFISNSTNTISSTYHWNFGDSGTSNLQNPSHLYIASGLYNVMLVVTNLGGCSDSILISSYINANGTAPMASFTSTNNCVNSSINFIDNSSVSTGSITNWAWNFSDGVSTGYQNPIRTFSVAGVYSVTLTVSNSQGCFSTITKTLTIENKPVVNFISNNTTGCVPFLVNFINNSTPTTNVIYNWNFNDTHISSLIDPINTFTSSGNYSIKLVVTTVGGCADSLIKTNYILAQSTPTSLFSLLSNTLTLPISLMTTLNNSINYTNVFWSFGDGTSSTLINPIHTYADTGKYNVCLTTYNSYSCSSISCTEVLVDMNNNIVAIPEAFTPNDDGSNDLLKVKGGPFLEIDFKVFNEWGNLIFSSNSQNEGWNGTFKGEKQPVGAYEYVLKGVTDKNKKINLYGIINLIR